MTVRTLKVVEPNFVHQVWPIVAQYIVASNDKGQPYPEEYKDYTVEHVKGFLTSGQWTLIVALDENEYVQGAATMSLFNYPQHRVAFITSTGGKFVVDKNTVDQVKQIAKHYGATKLQAYGRPSMVRLMNRAGFETRNTLMETLI